ncbi:MAG: DPP IV N-terminal domain-containing protein [Ferruginibacter sp.]
MIDITLRNILLAFSLFISTHAFSQNENINTGNLSPIFDISPDNKNIVLSIAAGPVSNLYSFSLAENKLSQLTKDKNYYSRPVFSPQGDKIIFLSKDLETGTSDLCCYDLNTKKIKKLTDGKTYVTEAAFMPTGNEILYCGAGTITNYSPLARKAPHEIDLYSISVEAGNSRKLTNFSAYEFSAITPYQKGDTILCKLIIKGVEGIYLLSLSDSVKTKIEAINNPRPQIGESFYGTPALAKNKMQISFTAPYQLYIMNLADKKCEEIWSTLGKDELAMPIFSKYNGTNENLFFSVLPIVNRQYSRSAKLYSYDLTTKKLLQIFIPVTN